VMLKSKELLVRFYYELHDDQDVVTRESCEAVRFLTTDVGDMRRSDDKAAARSRMASRWTRG
jgi:hypothetical protein